MEFTFLTISGILNLFKNGILRLDEIIKADCVISEKIMQNCDFVQEKDNGLYQQFLEVVRRVRGVQQNTSNTSLVVPQMCANFSDKSQQVINEFDLGLLDSSLRSQQVIDDFDLSLFNSSLPKEPSASCKVPKQHPNINMQHKQSSESQQIQKRFYSKSNVSQVPRPSTSRDVQPEFGVNINMQQKQSSERQQIQKRFYSKSNVSQVQRPSTSRDVQPEFGANTATLLSKNSRIPTFQHRQRSFSTLYGSQEPQPSTSHGVRSQENQSGFGVSATALELNNSQISKFKYFSLLEESSRLVKKFNVEARSLTFKFEYVGSDSNPMSWLEAAFEELRNYITRGFEPGDQIGLVLRNPNFADKPIGLSFRRVDQLSTPVILAVLEEILQSNAQFFSRDVMTLQVDKVHLPSGYGRTHLTGVSFEEFCDRKVGILVVPNRDNFCLASAIVLAIAFKTKDPEFNLMKIGLPVLKQRTRELCRIADVNLTNGGSYQHIQKLQDHLVNYTIVVYNSRYGETTYFEGPRESDRVTLNLLLENAHYNVITSLTSAFTTPFFCELCKTRFSDKKNHRRCLYTCPACHTSPPCWYMFNRVQCKECHRDFRGEECLASHKRSGLCKRLYRCPICFHSIWRGIEKNHKCGEKFCVTCQKQQPVRHFCFMAKNNSKKVLSAKNTLFVFYDLESRQETQVSGSVNSFLHEPNLCVAAHVCMSCLKNEDVKQNCNFCGRRLNVFSENPVQQFLNYVSRLAKKFKVTVLAHNFKGYDGCFVLKEIIKNREKWNPKIISTGTKIISITCNQIRFIDSLNYIPLPLSKLPKTFDFPESKGYFPYLFNTTANANHIGEMPEVEYYAVDQMSSSDRETFLRWYADEKRKGVVFDMKREIVKYCIMDVQILLKACLRFWKIFKNENGVDCFQEATTIASACNLVFRRGYLKDNIIGLIPPGGYRLVDKQSQIAIQWLLWLEHSLHISIQHCGKTREFRIPEGILVDGYCPENNTVYEFLGCFWHGCEYCFPNQIPDCEDSDEDRNNAMFLRRENTEARADRIKSYGYKLVQERECRFKRFLKSNEEARVFVENHAVLKHEPLNPRDGFFGGRTNAIKLYHKCSDDEKIHYFDLVSLYPFINKYAKYPKGHPKIHIGHDACSRLPVDTVEGLIKCRILPPTKLFHPLLPYKLHKKLMFILCRTCGETLNQNNCTHNDLERSFVGTFVADELRKAVSLNYRILEYHEIWEYEVEQYNPDTKTGGFFSGYIDNFLRIKQECSGWPESCVTDEDKNNYIREYFLKEGIQLRKDRICKNPGMRFLAKLMLNSFWGKFGQRENLMQTSIIVNPQEFFKLLTDPSVEVHSIIPVDDVVLLVNWNRREDAVKPLKTVNVAIAAYTTANARLELYKYLEGLNERVLYFDTDSVIFLHKDGEWKPETGEFLGQMKDEVEEYGVGSYITEFVSGGPKNYSYSVYSTNQKANISVCKIKGITLNFQNSNIINFDKMREMVCGNDDVLYINTDRKIVRTSTYDVISKPEQKMYRINYNKRRRIPDSYGTLPYGCRK